MKKALIMIVSVIMVFCFAGCGGSSGEAEQKDNVSEPNAGIDGIVFAVPDGWEEDGSEPDVFLGYKGPNPDLQLGINAVNEAHLNDYGDAGDAKTVQEYYDKYYIISDEDVALGTFDLDAVEVCGVDANYVKHKNGDKGYVDLSVQWLYDDVIYDVYLMNQDAYDENGDVIPDTPVLSDDEIAMFEDFVKSIQPGDGNSFK